MAHHIQRMKEYKPVVARIGLTNRCNHRCVRCSSKYRPAHNPNAEWDVTCLQRFAKEFKVVGKACVLGGGGEPLVYPHFVTSVKHFLDLEFELGISTNGSNLSPEIADLLSKFAWVRISIDACIDKTYQKLRHTHDSFNKSFRYIDRIRNGGCVVGANFVIQPENMREIAEFAKIVKANGFDNCRYNLMHGPINKPSYEWGDSQLDIIKEQLARACEYEAKDFKIFVHRGIPQVAAAVQGETSRKEKEYGDCYYSRIVLAFAPDECLYTCCTTKENPDFKIGCFHNMSLTSLLQLWKQHFPVDVTKCPPCWWDDKNKIAEYLLSKNPPHVNFP